MPDPIYLDHNATTPPAPEVVAATREALEVAWGNPSSAHPQGLRARRLVARARASVAALLGADEDEVVFTSGGTESDHLALRGVAQALGARHVVISAVEHPAVVEAAAALAALGVAVGVVPVDGRGLVDPDALRAALRPDTALVSVMHANNEVGAVQPLAALAAVAHAGGALLHADGAQAVGKIPARVRELGVDLYTVAAHKLEGPKGVGALWVRRGVPLAPLVAGGGQERGRRAGTEAVPGIAGLGAAAALAADVGARAAAMRAARDRLHRGILSLFPAVLNGPAEERLPNTLSLAFPGVPAGALLSALADRVAASAGAACHAGEVRPSATLRAMGVDPELARATIRLSTGRTTTLDEADEAARAIGEAARELRGAAR